MKKLFLLIALMLAAASARAQMQPLQATLNSASTGACTPTSCLAYQIPNGVGSAGISIVGSSGTVVFEVFDMNGNYASVNVTPSTSSTDVSTATVTGTQFFQATHIAGQYGFRIRLTASGSAAVTINPSTASARASGTGGGASGVSSLTGDGTIITNSGSTGAVTLTADTQTGTGSIVLANTPSLTTPAIGAATGTSLNLGATGTLSTTAQSGTGSLCMTTNCSMTTPALGTPSAVTLTNATGYTFPLTAAGTVTSGGVPYNSSTTQVSSSALLAAHAIVQGGGAGTAPATGNGDFTIDSTAHTLKAGASGLVDLSSEGVNGLILPTVSNTCPSTNGAIEFNTNNYICWQAGNTQEIPAVIPVANIGGFTGTQIPRNNASGSPQMIASALSDNGTNVTSSEPVGPRDGSFGSTMLAGASACETAFGATTLATGTTTTQTGQNCLPANSLLDAVVARVTTTITGSCTGWELGDGTTAARFTTNNATLTAGTTATILSGSAWGTGIASATTGMYQANAAKITITCAGGNPSAGAIRVIVYYHQATNPTS